MSKIDELSVIYDEAHEKALGEAQVNENFIEVMRRAQRAGIRAVIAAVRDEFGRIMYPGDDWNRQGILEQFDQILASSEGGQAAGGPTSDGGTELDRTSGPAPAAPAPDKNWAGALQWEADCKAALPAPAPVCVWVDVGDKYKSACGRSHFAWTSRDGVVVCPECKAPIKFTEAK